MTRKDYRLLAFALLRARAVHSLAPLDPAVTGVETVERELCVVLQRDNPRFNPIHFMEVVRGERALTSSPRKGDLKL